MFHCLAKTCADLLLGGDGADKGQMAWRQVYRALEHNNAKNACRNRDVLEKFPKKVEDFANHFVGMQEKRHQADYDPYVTLTKSEVLQDIAITKQVLVDFMRETKKDRRAFCVWVLFKNRL